MKEALKEAAKDFLKTECSIYPSDSKILAHKAFISGAEWQLNSVWHDAKEYPERGNQIIVFTESGNFTSWFSTENISSEFERFSVTKWAYVKDIAPKGGVK